MIGDEKSVHPILRNRGNDRLRDAGRLAEMRRSTRDDWKRL
jgi:hypothetical protein